MNTAPYSGDALSLVLFPHISKGDIIYNYIFITKQGSKMHTIKIKDNNFNNSIAGSKL